MLLSFPSSVNAQEELYPLEWLKVSIPGLSGNTVVQPSDVSKIAVSNQDTIYAIDVGIDTLHYKVYRTETGGASWEDITTNVTNAGAAPPFIDIATAPDKPSVVAVVTDGGLNVYLSIDGGDTWNDTHLKVTDLNGTTIQCIDISRGYFITGNDIYWDMSIGTALWGDIITSGQLWISQINGASGWVNQNISTNLVTNTEVSALRFSPNYSRGDSSILVIGSTAVDLGAPTTFLIHGRRDLSQSSSPSITWNALALYYPIPIVPSGDDVDVSRIISSLALPSDYNSLDPSSRVAFMSYNRRDKNPTPINEALNDVYRMDFSKDLPLNARDLNAGIATSDSFVNISSITYYGLSALRTAQGDVCNPGVTVGAKLLAGDYYAGDYNAGVFNSTWPFVQLRRCMNPIDPFPVSWQKASQPPTGPSSAQLAWSSDGTIAYCGTSQIPDQPIPPPPPPIPPDPDESAFSRSLDNGDNWEQISLIDTIIRTSDVAPAPDSKSLFIATFSASFEWIWRSAGEPLGQYWGRIFGTAASSTKRRLILRMSPTYMTDYTIYAAEEGYDPVVDDSSILAVTHDRGNSWLKRHMPSNMLDLVVADSKTVYVALPGGQVRKSTSEGQVWQFPADTRLKEINMLSLTKNGHLLVGSQDGWVSYSTDNATSFIKVPQPVTDIALDGDVQVISDNKYTSNNVIYAGTDLADNGIWRWKIGTSAEWELIDKPVIDLKSGERFSGLAMGDEGTLYTLRMEPANGDDPRSGGMNRSLNPDEPVKEKVEWDVLNRTLPDDVTFDPTLHVQPDDIPLFDHTIPYLKISGDLIQNQLWSIDTHRLDDPVPDPDEDLTTIYRFIDNLCKSGAYIDNPDHIGCDPVSGRNQGFNLIWEQLSLSDRYELHIDKSESMTLPVFSAYITPYSITSPSLVYLADGEGLGGMTKISLFNPLYDGVVPSVGDLDLMPVPSLECGHGYYWRVRTRHAVTGEFIRSPWSRTGGFIFKAGFEVVTPYSGPQLLAPVNNCGCSCNAPVCFSWSPFKETTGYVFELSENADMSSPLISTLVDESTAFQYPGNLKCDANYFWRVMAQRPATSEWSATFSFKTQPEQVIQPVIQTPSRIHLWVWFVIAVFSLLIICMLVLIIYRRRV